MRNTERPILAWGNGWGNSVPARWSGGRLAVVQPVGSAGPAPAPAPAPDATGASMTGGPSSAILGSPPYDRPPWRPRRCGAGCGRGSEITAHSRQDVALERDRAARPTKVLPPVSTVGPPQRQRPPRRVELPQPPRRGAGARSRRAANPLEGAAREARSLEIGRRARRFLARVSVADFRAFSLRPRTTGAFLGALVHRSVGLCFDLPRPAPRLKQIGRCSGQ